MNDSDSKNGFELLEKRSLKWITSLVALLILSIIIMLYSLSRGAVETSVFDVIRILFGGGTEMEQIALIHFRFPRVFMAMFVGAGLAVSGVSMQGLFRNPMASPFILGLSSGAAFGAALAMVFGIAILPGYLAVPSMAFAFCLLTLFLVYNIARIGGRVPVETLLLAGIAVGAFFSALVNLMTYLAGDELEGIVFWMMGDLDQQGWQNVHIVLPMVIIGAAIIMYYSRDLNAMMLGDNHAQNLGIDVGKVRVHLLIACALATAASVAFVGIIGFVGLVIPHIMRLLVGPDHRILVPTSLLAGGIFLMIADVLARWILAPEVLPIGIITALIGAPYFVYLLRRRRKEVGW